MGRDETFSRGDFVAGAVLVVMAVVYGLVFFDLTRVPTEDAAMLMRYAQHLGEGHGIVWNIGGEPVDGATDFLFMVMVAGLHALGLAVEHAVLGLCSLAHLLTVVLVFWGARRFVAAPRWAAFLSGAFIALGPGMLYTEAYFGTAVFALFIALTWIAALRVVEAPTGRTALAFALTSLLTGLVRPEGVLVAVFVLAGLVLHLGWRRARAAVLYFGAVFLVLGGAYFLWRLDYFGQPLPNPFYAKQGGHLYPWAVEISIWDVWSLTFPFNVALILGAVALLGWAAAAPEDARVARFFRATGFALVLAAVVGLLRTSSAEEHDLLYLERYSLRYAQLLLRVLLAGVLSLALSTAVPGILGRVARAWRPGPATVDYLERCARATLLLIVPVVGFTLMWGIIEDHTNYLMRFRYPIVAVVVMSWPFILPHHRRRWHPGLVAALGVLVALSVVLINTRLLPDRYHGDGRYDMALMLREYAGGDQRMATTEAGLLPLYSTWPALDLFGLNDQRIARAGAVEPPYLDDFDPTLIVVSAPYPIEPIARGSRQHMRRRIVQTVHDYAAARGFELAAALGGDRGKVHYYYVHSDHPDGPAIIERIRSLDYAWYLTGEPAVDFSRSR